MKENIFDLQKRLMTENEIIEHYRPAFQFMNEHTFSIFLGELVKQSHGSDPKHYLVETFNKEDYITRLEHDFLHGIMQNLSGLENLRVDSRYRKNAKNALEYFTKFTNERPYPLDFASAAAMVLDKVNMVLADKQPEDPNASPVYIGYAMFRTDGLENDKLLLNAAKSWSPRGVDPIEVLKGMAKLYR